MLLLGGRVWLVSPFFGSSLITDGKTKKGRKTNIMHGRGYRIARNREQFLGRLTPRR